MSTAARIDELRKKFEENPRRYFAPLANEYRKTGDLAQAIALCREHLPKQPGHMSGYIVFGQALFEAGELLEAREVFEQAIDLDPENLIALRHLGEIAKAQGDVETARRWWGRVYDADPRNDDIAAQLATLSTAPTPVASPAVVPSFDTLAKATETPAFPMIPIGFGMTPTPDAVMRAIDMDAVHASMRQQEPIDLDADEEGVPGDDLKANSLYSAAEASAAIEAATTDLAFADDARAMGTGDEFASVDEELAPAPSEAIADPFDFPESPDVAAEAHDEPLASHALIDVDADAFEEGLVAAEWPDTSELVARVLTPRSFTPRSLTPLSTASLDDAVSAFGREPGDAISAASNDAEPVASFFEGNTYAVEESVEESVEATVEVSVESSVEAFVEASVEEPIEASVEEPIEASVEQAIEASVEDAIDASVAEPVEAMVNESIDATSEEPSLELDADVTFGTAFRGDLDDEEAPFVESAASPDEAHELPWIAMAAPGTEATDEEVENAEPGLEAIAEAFAEDARTAGEQGPMTFAAMDDARASGESESFADVAQQLIDDDMAEASGVTEPEAPAFVTETMGELLVSQGFLARAIDVYGELVRRRPYDPVLASRLEELQGMLHANADSVAVPFEEQRVDAMFSAELDATFAPESASEFASELVSDAQERDRPTPTYGTPTYGTPVFGTSALDVGQQASRVTPYAQPSVFEEVRTRRSAREWFAAIAARRVPRRTPSQSTAAVAEETPDGLATLFGNDPSMHDDAAARALADAFAPVSAQEIEASSSFDFGVRHETPAFSSAVTPPRASPVPPATETSGFSAARGPSITPVTGSNAGFSFDRFFPDPAMRRVTPAPSAPAIPDAPVTDDLAQFSAWLKGLGNS